MPSRCCNLRMGSLKHTGGSHPRASGSRESLKDGAFACHDQPVVVNGVEALHNGSGVDPTWGRPVASHNVA
eukprot:6215342-Pyramimonas_sp.AAC.1